jgi:signal transduction histidine kinase/CheY-like chemotaxis protein
MVDYSYHQILHEFRADIFQRVTVILAVFCIAAGFGLVYVQPLPHQFILTLQLSGVFIFYIRHIAEKHPALARYLFVMSLYALLGMGMLMLPFGWLPFIIAPLLFISELLVSRGSIIAGVLFVGFVAFLVQSGYADYPVPALTLFILVVLIVFHSSLRTIWVLLHWYFSMYGKNSMLLEEIRTRRAELLQTVKSLEIAHETQQRLQTQLIYARQQAEESRRMKERFASNISHELRTPLNIILGFTEIMHLTPEVYGPVNFPPKLQQDIYQIHRNSRHLLDMMDDVLDLSHIEMSQFSLNFERTDLTRFLQDTIEMVENLFQNKPVEFIVDIAQDLPEVQIDRTRIRQVIINLINNAHRFTSAGSVIFRAYADEQDVIFQVEDTGIGIARDQMQLIFDEFFQVDYSLSRSTGGAGLGLAITRRFIEAHNGHLLVESEQGKGSVFTFTLPLPSPTRKNATLAEKPKEAGEVARENLWLVVDSDPHVSRLITRHIERCSVIQIDNDEQLPAALHRYSPQGVIFNNPPAAPIPENLMNLPVPVVVCSLPSTTQMVRQLGVDACLPKPILPQQLIQHLRAYQHIENVLVIDDDVGVVQLVQRTLENSLPDLIVRRAYDGNQACEIMKMARPDLVLLDLVMPNMSGFEVIAAMKADSRLRDIPVILLTATKYVHSDDETCGEIRIYQHGGLKPSEVLKLLSTISLTFNSQIDLTPI